MTSLNKRGTRRAVPFQLAALLCAAPALAQSPSTAPQAAPPAAAAPERVLPAGGAMPSDDPRLARKVTLTLDNVTVSRALLRLSAASGVSLVADGEQLQGKRISAAFAAKPLRDVLDALASLGDYEWAGRRSGTFVLRAVAHTAVDPKVDKWGQDLRGLVAQMTPAQQQALSVPYGTSLSDLSPDMQAAVLGALAAMPDPRVPDGTPPVYQTMLNNQNSLMVGFQAEQQDGGCYYYLSTSVPGRCGGVILIGKSGNPGAGPDIPLAQQ